MKRISMYRNVGGKKIHVNQLAANSRKFSVSNNTIPKSNKEFFMIPFSNKNIDTTGKYWFIPGVPGTMFIKHEKPNPETGNHYVMVDYSWEHKKYPQPKNLHKKRKAWKKVLMVDPCTPEDVKLPYVYKKEYPAKKSEYRDYTLPKMNKVQYCEKLVEHKLVKWERKNPKPADMFTEEVEKWKQLRETAKERFRDFVVSVYDPLVLTGRFVVGKDNSATYQEKKVAEIKDINGEGHKVNELPKNSKLMKKAQKVTNHVKDKHPNLIACNLKDHKRQKGRIILPKAA